MDTKQSFSSSSARSVLGGNLLLRTDSYKASHWKQYPPGAQTVYSYIESRGGPFSHGVFFGLQAWLREYLSRGFDAHDIDEATEMFALHGEPFNREGWLAMLAKYGGAMPVRIRAVPEGTVVPIKNALLAIENTAPEFYWATSYLETELLRAVWYPTTVATLSAACKAIIARYLNATADDTAGQIGFKLHDFGARGVSSLESAALGGLAHLVNFMGTDTVIALSAARRYYDAPMAGFSIPAAEHSTITSWGREHEVDAYRNMLKQFTKPGSVVAIVSDSYDIYNACDSLWGGALREEVINSGATVVIRPDSGHPPEVVLKVAEILSARFGFALNSKGFRVLNNVRIMQGDGINIASLRECLSNLYHNGFSAENIAFGMGGGLLQQVNRDTMQFAMKCSAMKIGDAWRDVFKSPIGDAGKNSKKGQVELFRDASGKFVTHDRSAEAAKACTSAFETVYENGAFAPSVTFDDVRSRAAVAVEIMEPEWRAL